MTVCSHRHINVMALVQLAQTMSENNSTQNKEKPIVTNYDRAMIYSSGLFSNLKKLNNILNGLDKNRRELRLAKTGLEFFLVVIPKKGLFDTSPPKPSFQIFLHAGM